MFSGLIAYRGSVASLEPLAGGGATLHVRCDGVEFEHPQAKDSIAINGACLTVASMRRDVLSFDVVPETLERSALGALNTGETVNVEYALRLGDRLGGHFVYGHVDAAARVVSREREGQGERLRVERPAPLRVAIVEKAFIAIDGVSVTVAACASDWFDVALIPETLARTTLGSRPAGSRVNLEVDPLARYVAAVLHAERGAARA